MSNTKESNQENKAKEIATVALGCLLHDIGKPIQRADKENELKRPRKNHQSFGRDFIDNLAAEKSIILSGSSWLGILDSISFHHAKKGPSNSNSYIPYIAFEADNLASAHDRRSAFLYDHDGSRKDECEIDENKWDSKRRLQSIFTYFQRLGQTSSDHEYKSFYDLWLKKDDHGKLNLYPYPKSESETENSVKAQYGKIEKLIRQLCVNRLISKEQFDIYDLNEISYYLEELLQFVPPDTYKGHTNDVSLYEHLKLTAAIGSCMFAYIYDHDQEWITAYNPELKKESPWGTIHHNSFREEKKAYVLFKADISGIQEFIYNISSKQALKGLRGRSFYLELLCQQIADEILKTFGLGRVNQVYLGGGGFSLLLPNTKNLMNDLNEIENVLNQWLLKKHDGKLFIAFGFSELSGNDLRSHQIDHPLNHAWKEVSERIGEKKLCKFHNDLDEIFSKKDSLYEECNFCHKEAFKLEPYKYDEDNKELMICEECKSLNEYGKNLNRADKFYLSFKQKNEKGLFPQINRPTQAGLFSINSLDLVWETQEPQNKVEYFVIHNNNENLVPKIKISTTVAKKNDEVLDFRELAEEAQGVKRIAVLRADVDNLGKVFKSDLGFGFRAEHKSLSRDTSLSNNLARFFTFYLDDLLSGLDYITVVYAGGDDLFLVGAWDKVIEAAFKINDKFRKYTLGTVSLSAGISIHNPKFPLYRMAEAAGLAESVAKTANGNVKNSLCIFFDDGIFRKESPSHVFLWEDWKDIQNEMKLLESFKLSSAYIYQILIYVRELIAKRRSYHFPRLIYATARMEEENEDLRKNLEWDKFKKSLFEECFESQKEFLENPLKQNDVLLILRKLETALNYLLLLRRESEKGEDHAK